MWQTRTSPYSAHAKLPRHALPTCLNQPCSFHQDKYRFYHIFPLIKSIFKTYLGEVILAISYWSSQLKSETESNRLNKI